MPASPRLVVIGLDGATWDVIDPLLASGDLPHLAHLLQSGRRGALESVFPPLTAPAWQSIFTGMVPDEHGVFEMTVYDRALGRRRPVCMNDWHGTPLWDRVTELGFSGGYLGIPFTYPPTDVNGWLVSGIMGTPSYTDRMARPPHLFAEITHAAGEYPLDRPEKRPGSYPRDVLNRQIAWLHDVALYLLRNHPVDVIVVVENYTDFVQHFFLRTRVHDGVDMIALAYRAADRLLGDIRAEVGPDVPVMVLSDHGAMPIEGYINSARIVAAVSPHGEARKRAAAWSFAALKRLWRTTGKALLRALGVDPARLSEWGVRTLQGSPDDPKATVVGHYGSVWLTSDPRATKPEDVERAARALAGLHDPSGLGPLLEVAKGGEGCSGVAAEQAPHLLARPRRGSYEFRQASPVAPLVILPEEAERADVECWATEGTHSPEGIWALSAAGVQASAPGSLADVMGTLMELLGVAPDAGLRPATERAGAIGRSGYTPDEEKAILGRLYDLGYID